MPSRQSDRLRLIESVLALSPDGIVVVDRDERPIFVSDVGKAIIRRTLQPDAPLLQQLTDYQFVDAEGKTLSSAASPIASALAGETLRDLRISAARPDLSEASLSISASPVRDCDGEIIGAAIILREVGRLEVAEEALRRTEAHYRALIDAIPDVAHVKDATGRYVLVNSAMAASVRKTKEEIVGRTALDVHIAGIAPKIAADDESVLRTGTTLDTEEVVTSSRGTTHYHVRKAPLLDTAGRVTGIVTISRDVTERRLAEESLRQAKTELEAAVVARTADLLETNDRLRRELIERERAERALLESEAKYRALFEAEADAVFLVDWESGQIIDVNEAACRLYGYERDEFRQLRDVDVATESDRVRAATLRDRVRVPLSYHRRRDGTVFPVEISASGLVLGGVRVQVAAVRDVSERQQLEAYRRRFLDLAAHEMRTPITVLMGYLQMIAAREARSSEDARIYRMLHAQAVRLGHIVRRLGDAAYIQSGKLRLRPVSVDLAKLARRTVDELRSSRPDREVVVSGADEVVVLADRDWTREVLTNLLDNAIRYGPTGQPIEIGVVARDGDGIVSVRDHGVGIPREKLSRVFEPYYQVDPMVSPTVGMGLGLYISREIVGLQGGRIWVESESGFGSTFSFSLPTLPSDN